MDAPGEDRTETWVHPLPPFGTASGPLVDDGEVVTSYVGEGPPCHSARLHIEGPTLVVDGDVAAGLRLGPDVVMVRVDLPDEASDVRSRLEQALAAESLECLDESSTLALPVALQILGLRLSAWDLWGTDVDVAFAALRRCAIGDQEFPAC
jgi:hypothetical protein